MATTYTPNYHLGKQEDRSDKFLMSVITDNMDIIDEQLKATDDKATAAAAGLKYKGAVNYYSDLPNNAEIGDAYTVLYAGSSGSVADGREYVWGKLNDTAQWIDFSKDSYTKAEVNALLAAKQSALNTAQLAAVNSGITTEDVEQIGINQNNILLKQDKIIYTDNTLESGTYTNYTTVLTYTTPSKPCVLIATAYYSSSSPTGIRIGLGSNNVLVGENTNPNGYTMLSLTTIAFDGGGNTVTVQAKSLAAGTLKASLTVIPLSTT